MGRPHMATERARKREPASVAVGGLVFPQRIYKRFVPLSDARIVAIGRAPRCDISLPDRTVTWVHAVLKRERDYWTLRDNRSRNGTFARLPGAPYDVAIGSDANGPQFVLFPGIELTFGNTVCYVADIDGRVPYCAATRSQFYRLGYRIYGAFRVAAAKIRAGKRTIEDACEQSQDR